MHPLADGTPLALASAFALLDAIPNMLAVVRPDNDALLRLFSQHGIATILAPRAGEGMGASLAAGVAATADSAGWLIALADMPRVQAATIAAVIAALRNGAAIAAPVYRGERGHPVGFSAKFGARLQALTGDSGARSLLGEYAAELVHVDCEDPGILLDVDHPVDLRRL